MEYVLLTLRQPYLTLSASCEFEIEPIKHSRFIATAVPVPDEILIPDALDSIKTKTPVAEHHCWAYAFKLPERMKYSDDGEPSGSAGRPMINQLQGRGLFDCLVVVARYFGGTKLGVGGLMRAYGGAVGQCLDRADIATITPTVPLWLRYDYSDTSSVESALLALALEAAETIYGEHIDVRLQIPDKQIIDIYKVLSTQVGGRLKLVLPEEIEQAIGR